MEVDMRIRPHSVMKNETVWEYRNKHDTDVMSRVVSIYTMPLPSDTYTIYVNHDGPLCYVEGFLSAQLKALELLEDNA